MKKYIVYKTTNLLDGKFYIGKTTIGNVNYKYYLGSGIHLLRAIKLYGKENFTREILYEFDNEEDAYKKEKELLTTELLESSDCYNIKQGGKGGWKHSHESITKIKEKRSQQQFSDETKKKMSESQKGRAPWNKGKKMPRELVERQAESRRGLTRSDETKEKMSAAQRGKTASEETKKKMSESKKKQWASGVFKDRNK